MGKLDDFWDFDQRPGHTVTRFCLVFLDKRGRWRCGTEATLPWVNREDKDSVASLKARARVAAKQGLRLMYHVKVRFKEGHEP